ncbi:hypothetical protein XELAEV_18016033mg [Xenopus laevis]|uniref:Uncharacterized protein n=1 Tax=Xenopus laevis TaxID=8355 RepID=A0A974DLL9_XENLA|nr:hypothetical protein XELAEV_18016033mg [Xenopus laevis]
MFISPIEHSKKPSLVIAIWFLSKAIALFIASICVRFLSKTVWEKIVRFYEIQRKFHIILYTLGIKLGMATDIF